MYVLTAEQKEDALVKSLLSSDFAEETVAEWIATGAIDLAKSTQFGPDDHGEGDGDGNHEKRDKEQEEDEKKVKKEVEDEDKDADEDLEKVKARKIAIWVAITNLILQSLWAWMLFTNLCPTKFWAQ